MSETTAVNYKKKIIIFSAVALLVGGGLGYYLGSTMKESELTDKYTQQLAKFGLTVNEAQEIATDAANQSQATQASNQQTIETLKAENAQLKTTIQTQQTKIADLEKQLEEANKSDTNTPQ